MSLSDKWTIRYKEHKSCYSGTDHPAECCYIKYVIFDSKNCRIDKVVFFEEEFIDDLLKIAGHETNARFEENLKTFILLGFKKIEKLRSLDNSRILIGNSDIGWAEKIAKTSDGRDVSEFVVEIERNIGFAK